MNGFDELKISRPSKTLREIALDVMRGAILNMRFKPGERLIERDLCDQLGVSRTIVREVLRHLESEGLVTTLPNRGPIVAITTADEAQQIYEIRGILEAIAARECARKADPATVKLLQNALKQIRSGYKSRDNAAILAATTQFYQAMFEGASRDVAWSIVSAITGRVNHLRSMTIQTQERATAGPKELETIIEAIRTADEEAAYKAALDHVKNASIVAQRLLEESSTAGA